MCAEFRAGEKLLEAAVARNDTSKRILVQVQEGSPDCVASDLLHHFSGYRNYTHPATINAVLHRAVEPEPGVAPYQTAFNSLAASIDRELFLSDSIQAIRLDKITHGYRQRLKGLGFNAQFRTSMLKKRLMTHLGDRILLSAQEP